MHRGTNLPRMTCPIYLVYDSEYHMIKNDFDYHQLLNMIKVRNDDKTDYDEGINTIEEIVSKRADLSLFDENVLRFLIKKSGGVLRYLFHMIRDAVTEAYMRNSSTISQEDAEIAYRNLKSEYVRTIHRQEEIDTLKRKNL